MFQDCIYYYQTVLMLNWQALLDFILCIEYLSRCPYFRIYMDPIITVSETSLDLDQILNKRYIYIGCCRMNEQFGS